MSWTRIEVNSVRQVATWLLDLSLRGRERATTGFGFYWRGEPERFESGIVPRLARKGPLRGDSEAERLNRELEWYTDWWVHVLSLMAPRDQMTPFREDGIPELAWLNYAAHYGCPTRLIDWSESPWVALYFACSQSPTHPGRLWCFDGDALATAIRGRWDEWQVPPVAAGGDERDIAAGAFRSNSARWLTCQFNQAGPARMAAQKGLFTIASRLEDRHDVLIDELVPDGAKFEFTIPANGLKVGILGFLSSMGVDHESLKYPMLDRVGDSLKPPYTERL